MLENSKEVRCFKDNFTLSLHISYSLDIDAIFMLPTNSHEVQVSIHHLRAFYQMSRERDFIVVALQVYFMDPFSLKIIMLFIVYSLK